MHTVISHTMQYLQEVTNLEQFFLENEFRNFLPSKGVLIYDSVNNPFFPYKEIVNDTYKFEYWKYFRFLETSVFGQKLIFSPFHFFIEFVEINYVILNTRPISISAPDNVPNLRKLKNKELINLYKNTWHICILGDYKNNIPDIYLKRELNSFLISMYNILRKHGATPPINKSNFINCVNLDCYKFIDTQEFPNPNEIKI